MSALGVWQVIDYNRNWVSLPRKLSWVECGTAHTGHGWKYSMAFFVRRLLTSSIIHKTCSILSNLRILLENISVFVRNIWWCRYHCPFANKSKSRISSFFIPHLVPRLQTGLITEWILGTSWIWIHWDLLIHKCSARKVIYCSKKRLVVQFYSYT